MLSRTFRSRSIRARCSFVRTRKSMLSNGIVRLLYPPNCPLQQTDHVDPPPIRGVVVADKPIGSYERTDQPVHRVIRVAMELKPSDDAMLTVALNRPLAPRSRSREARVHLA